ncbi:MAG TPA: hypothetical protein VHC22_31535 [Pirellulales bacterium]|nr:hypothetical protein [Pirellulales bacterium]
MNPNLFLGEPHTCWTVMYQAAPVEPKKGPVRFHEIALIVLTDGTAIKLVMTKPMATDEEPAAQRQNSAAT